MFPSLKGSINMKFSNVKDTKNNLYNAKADFNRTFRQLYVNRDLPKTKRMKEINRTKESTSKSSSFSESNQKFCANNKLDSDDGQTSDSELNGKLSPIWCMDYMENLIVLGCADGRLEFWEGSSGKLKVRLV